MAHPKDIAAMIVASKKPGVQMPGGDMAGPGGPDEGDDSYDSEGAAACAEDAISAIKAGDADALAQALKSFMDMCHH